MYRIRVMNLSRCYFSPEIKIATFGVRNIVHLNINGCGRNVRRSKYLAILELNLNRFILIANDLISVLSSVRLMRLAYINWVQCLCRKKLGPNNDFSFDEFGKSWATNQIDRDKLMWLNSGREYLSETIKGHQTEWLPSLFVLMCTNYNEWVVSCGPFRSLHSRIKQPNLCEDSIQTEN